jgi:hypothetical protein
LIWSAAFFRRFFYAPMEKESKAAEKRRTPNQSSTQEKFTSLDPLCTTPYNFITS